MGSVLPLGVCQMPRISSWTFSHWPAGRICDYSKSFRRRQVDSHKNHTFLTALSALNADTRQKLKAYPIIWPPPSKALPQFLDNLLLILADVGDR